ncbi:MAG: tetratricopeptide repeat protein [Bacteroidia bacterium]|nr:tetratricopeptide repeat protein [Bacteroidia bacterium]
MENNDLIVISDYLAGDLLDAEKVAVEQRMQADADFAQLFRQQQANVHILRAVSRAEEKARLQQQFKSARQRQLFTRRLWTASVVAAGLAALLLIWFNPWKKTHTPEQLAMAYLESYPLPVERGAGQDSVLEDSAFQYYRQGDYVQAVPLLRKLHESTPEEAQITLLLGESLSQTAQYTEASEMFTLLAKDSPYKDAAQWRLALNQLLSGETAAAQQTLLKISGTSHYRSAQADSLLELLGGDSF